METAIAVIGAVVGILGVLFALVSAFRTKKADDAADGKKDGVVLTELGYIKSGVDDIKRKQEKQEQQHIEVISRLTAVEESAKQAHHRIDEFKNQLNNEQCS